MLIVKYSSNVRCAPGSSVAVSLIGVGMLVDQGSSADFFFLLRNFFSSNNSYYSSFIFLF